MRGVSAFLVGAAALAAVAAPAAGAPVVQRTIPLAGTVSGAAPGPGGGVMLVEQFLGGARGFDARTSARRPDGRVIWSRTEKAEPEAGEYDSPPFARQPNGTWGPVAYPLPAPRAYDSAGRPAPACLGTLDSTSLCVAGTATPAPVPGEVVPTIVARGPTGERWRSVLGDYRWDPTLRPAARVVRDRAGRVYADIGFATDGEGRSLSGVTVALSAADGTVLWRRSGAGVALAGLGRGYLAAERRRLVARMPDGATRWVRAFGSGTPRAHHVDTARGRVTVSGLEQIPRVVVLRAGDGRGIWGTPRRDRAGWLHTDAAGRTYVAATAGPRRGLVVLDRAGREVRRFRTALPIRHAVPMAGGRVALITQAPGDRPSVLRIVRWTR